MAKGRKPKTSHLKLIGGNAGKRPINKDEPKAVRKTPRPPKWLSKGAIATFKLVVCRLEEMGYASASHTEALAILAARIDEVKELDKIIRKEGSTYTVLSEAGQILWKARPEVAMRNAAAKHVQSLLVEFGLTPSAATRISAPSNKAKSSGFDNL